MADGNLLSNVVDTFPYREHGQWAIHSHISRVYITYHTYSLTLNIYYRWFIHGICDFQRRISAVFTRWGQQFYPLDGKWMHSWIMTLGKFNWMNVSSEHSEPAASTFAIWSCHWNSFAKAPNRFQTMEKEMECIEFDAQRDWRLSIASLFSSLSVSHHKTLAAW